jgi:hypothetical protein
MTTEANLDLLALWRLAWATQQATYRTHCHGIEHWVRGDRNALWLISELEDEVDELVVRLFAAFHDCQRRHDGRDGDHAPGAGALLGVALKARSGEGSG